MGQSLHFRDLVGTGPAKHPDVIIVDQWIVQRVALVEEFEDRFRQPSAFGNAVALGHRAGAHVAHHALHRDHLHRPHQRFALVQQADKVRGNGSRGELAHDESVDLVVGLPLLRQLRDLGTVEGAGVVAKMHDEQIGIVGSIDRLRLAAVELLPFFHGFL